MPAVRLRGIEERPVSALSWSGAEGAACVGVRRIFDDGIASERMGGQLGRRRTRLLAAQLGQFDRARFDAAFIHNRSVSITCRVVFSIGLMVGSSFVMRRLRTLERRGR